MNKRVEDLINSIKELEKELSDEFEKELIGMRERLEYSIEQGKVRFRQQAIAAQRSLKKDVYHYLRESNIIFIVSAPIIYAMIVPLLLLDLFLSVYQAVCFPLYRIAKVNREDYLIVDRQHLAYLNMIEKINCMYCGYGNGLLSYGLEIASRTEAFWCPIKHAKRPRDAHSRYHTFSEYGDAAGYEKRLRKSREARTTSYP
ncbi:hypothetical protein [Desulfosediminicola flagellatus]|uniref:hypothetical protein n=1 Tax=Desulfosediminicola flagellatus TaxID=2569541 RepID=UPI0010ACAFA3|nr:hypothetical protein [Desulfosediminicola flagellatus]